jgi:hypothetical protein
MMAKETRVLVAFYLEGEHNEEQVFNMLKDLTKDTMFSDNYIIEQELEEINEQEVTI